MRIHGFKSFVEATGIPHELKKCNVVIDAQNFFYDRYEKSKLQFEFGTECDNYAKFVKYELSMFKEVDIKCYFIFKSGTKDLEQKVQSIKASLVRPNNDLQNIHPILTVNVTLQVLQEMGFDYMFTEYETKSTCIGLAQRLSCPVISGDVEYTVRGVQYIPKNSLFFDERNQTIRCKIILRDRFIRKFYLDEHKLALFILLTDIHIFPGNSFDNFFTSIKLPKDSYHRYNPLIKKLSITSEEEILRDITDNVELAEERIYEELSKVKILVTTGCGSMMAYNIFFHDDHKLSSWFVNGVADNFITEDYINLYRSSLLFQQDNDSIDYVDLSLDIIKYAYDLLTNFSNDGFRFVRLYRPQTKVVTESITKPTIQVDQSVFQNGWNEIHSLGLFHHFIREKIKFDCNNLTDYNLNDDVKILMITLVYIFHNSSITTFTTEMGYGVLLSYVILGIVKDRIDNVDNVHGDNYVNLSDCNLAYDSLNDYFTVDNVNEIMDKNLLTSLLQFEYCLLQMNNLNKLCGSPFKQTIYRKTYNATFAYKIMYTMQVNGIISSVNNIFSPDSTVLQLFNNLVNIYNNLLQ